MLRSMTGFGAAASEEIGGYAVRVEVRSVNHRHLLVKMRGAGQFFFLEGEIERLVKQRMSRGSVSIHIKATTTSEKSARINPVVLRGYRAEIDGLAAELGIESARSVESLLSLPGVIDAPEDGATETQKLAKPLLKLIDEAISQLVEMRESEGGALTVDLNKNSKAVAAVLAKIEQRMPEVVKAHQESLEKRVNDLLEGRVGVNSQDLAREVAVLADRLDVSEEIARLGSHLDQFDAFLERGGDIGRKLDFLVQEIYREINTIGSKCSDAQVAHWVVDAKTHAERLREQVQNVE